MIALRGVRRCSPRLNSGRLGRESGSEKMTDPAETRVGSEPKSASLTRLPIVQTRFTT